MTHRILTLEDYKDEIEFILKDDGSLLITSEEGGVDGNRVLIALTKEQVAELVAFLTSPKFYIEAHNYYYPSGGIADLYGPFDSQEAADTLLPGYQKTFDSARVLEMSYEGIEGILPKSPYVKDQK